MIDLQQHSHRRFNPLTNEWVLVSPHRTARPWQGMVEPAAVARPPAYDPECYLCPGNQRAGGVRNPQYASTFIFENDFAALRPSTPDQSLDQNEQHLICAEGERGTCRVMSFSPRHDVTLASMDCAAIRTVIDVWAEQYDELASLGFITHVQIFENRGAMMGASNPHPHCQIWATAHLPNEPAKELGAQRAYAARRSCLLCDYVALERKSGERIVFSNEYFDVLVPFWAVWPLEVMLLPVHHAATLSELAAAHRDALADALKVITATYDRVFGVPFPYSMGFHQLPVRGAARDEWHLHVHFYPPLLRSATVRKVMVGFEMLGSPQRDITPERAAHRLRELAKQTHELARHLIPLAIRVRADSRI